MLKDYQSKGGTTAVKATLISAADEEYRIALTDADGKQLDVYTIDPYTGTGTNSAQEAVNLPQTGNNALTNRVIAVAALLLIAAGSLAVYASGVIRRRKEQDFAE